MATYSFYVNGREVTTEENKSLLRFLRDELPEELERLRNADPDRRAAALRAALCAES